MAAMSDIAHDTFFLINTLVRHYRCPPEKWRDSQSRRESAHTYAQRALYRRHFSGYSKKYDSVWVGRTNQHMSAAKLASLPKRTAKYLSKITAARIFFGNVRHFSHKPIFKCRGRQAEINKALIVHM